MTVRRPLALIGAAAALACGAADPARADDEAIVLDDIVVTATGRPEARKNVAGTVQVLDREKIERSQARSMTDLLAENAVGFFSEWTPGQTSINIRGGATDGQGKDFRSQVLVLINGRRAGTANLSKLSPADVERVEIVRGPASVIYGSQNIGGVINVIMKTGRTAPGVRLEASGGSWGLLQGRAQTGGVYESVDWYVGVSGGRRGDYHSGKGGSRMDNTAWKRGGATAALGLQLNEDHRVDVMARADGVYDVGFRGSGANEHSEEDRYNRSLDLAWSGQMPSGRVRWNAQTYFVQDVDDFHWASPVIRGSDGRPVPGAALDHNRRELEIFGAKLQPSATLWTGNDLLVGWDWETSRLRSDRYRVGVPGNPLAQVSPQDNNQTERVHSLYAEDSQKLLDDRLTLRAGVRGTWGETSFDRTPNLANQLTRTEEYDAVTYSLGATFQATERLVLRAGHSTGFRAPTATELAADFNTLGGGRIFGDPNLDPETSSQVEIGAAYGGDGWNLDAALFQNVIADRITTRLRSDNSNTSDYVNNSGDIVVRGLELQFDANLLRLAGREAGPWFWTGYANGAWNFHMKDKGASATANTDRPQRMYRTQAAIGTRFGQTGVAYDWSFQAQGVLRGPMWYDTEENLVAGAEPTRSYIHRKGSFMVWNVRGDVEVAKGVSLFAAMNNVFNKNQHPIFIGLDKQPYLLDAALANGGRGTSMPGREAIVGLTARF
ncbi:TonB-dependent receptor [Methylopila henanensis]|uniref:TonB-dependent receptor n=1 Tax=Methylopila henanensis TaxID=873516 RepID=A0ABW4KA88_9HYPH